MKSEITENVTITMTNVVGEKVKKWYIVSNKATDKQLNLPPGVYILTAMGSSYRFVTRVVVEQ